MLQHLNVFLVMRGPKLNRVLEDLVQRQICWEPEGRSLLVLLLNGAR